MDLEYDNISEMDASKEEDVKQPRIPLYNVGDLVYTSDRSMVGFIIDFKPGFINRYKIDLRAYNASKALENIWKTEWWNETSIQARVLSKKWFVQKKTT